MTHINRHRPRLCRECTAPMAGQSQECWQCGAVWTDPPSAPGPVASGDDPRDEAPQLVAAQQSGGGPVGGGG